MRQTSNRRRQSNGVQIARDDATLMVVGDAPQPTRRKTVNKYGTHRVEKTGEVDMTCWCGSTVQRVPLAWVAEGRTTACDRTKCKRIAEQRAHA